MHQRSAQYNLMIAALLLSEFYEFAREYPGRIVTVIVQSARSTASAITHQNYMYYVVRPNALCVDLVSLFYHNDVHEIAKLSAK